MGTTKGIPEAGQQGKFVMRDYQGPFMAEVIDSDHRQYFTEQKDMLQYVGDRPQSRTPMRWDENKNMYVVDFDSAELLGM